MRIEYASGILVNDYRICTQGVQVRSLDPAGQPIRDSLGSWRMLDEGDIALHHALRTPVSRWLRVRFRDPTRNYSANH